MTANADSGHQPPRPRRDGPTVNRPHCGGEYNLRLDIGMDRAIRTITGDTPAELAAAVCQHARGILGSSRCDVELDADTLTGTVRSHSAVVAEFTISMAEPEQPAVVDTSAPDHIVHGYTLRDLNRMARAACMADRSYSSDMTTRFDTAWSAIAEALAAADQPPGRQDLVRVGWQAIYRDVRAVQQLYGVDRSERAGAVASAPRFSAYWAHVPHHPDEGIIERLAVHQILASLPEYLRETVVALAVQDDYQKAADALGITYTAMTVRMSNARRQLRALWFAPETAPPIKGTDRRIGSHSRGVPTHCPKGHEYTPENTIRRPSSPRCRRCRICDVARDAARRERKKAAA